MSIVADASVLIGLSSIGQLALLRKRFSGGVLIPPAVWREVVEQGRGRPGAREVAEADWISVRDVTALEIVQLLQVELEEGETEAIALAHQVEAEVVLLDERNARRAAKQLGLQVLGTIGILVWARRTGNIASLRKALDALQTRAKFRISQQLYERALSEVGEQWA
jgi:predicted nucleic acid-binding protein